MAIPLRLTPRYHVHHATAPHPHAHRRPARPTRQRLDCDDDRPRRHGPRRTHRPDHQRPDQRSQEDHRALRPQDEYRAAPRRIDPLLRPGRPRRRRSPQHRPRRHSHRAGPHPLRRPTSPPTRLRHHNPRHPATPLPQHHRRDPQPRHEIIVRLDRRTYSPVLRQADRPTTEVPWWGGRRLSYEYR